MLDEHSAFKFSLDLYYKEKKRTHTEFTLIERIKYNFYQCK